MANPRPFVVDPVLTAIAIGYTNPVAALIADQVLPRVPTGSSFQYDVYGLEDFSAPNGKLGRRGKTPRIEFASKKEDSSVEDFGWESSIPVTDSDDAAAQRAANASRYDPRARATTGLTAIKQIAREKRVADIVFAAGTYASTRRVQLSGTSQLSDYANSDPVGVINAALDGTFVARPTHAVLSKYGWGKLRAHPKMVKSVKGGISGDGMISREQFVELFELQGLLVGEGQLNASAPGQDVSIGQVWGKHMALLHINPEGGPGGNLPTFGFTADCGGAVALSYFDTNVGLKGGEVIRVGERVREHVCAKDVGYFIQDAFA
jgi:hypothetical protein